MHVVNKAQRYNRHPWTSSLSILGVSLFWLGCGLVDLDEGSCADLSQSDLEIAVELGGQVRFTWPNDCVADELIVYEKSQGRELWIIDGRVRSPITYGTPPSGTTVLFGPGILEAGKKYYYVLVRNGADTGLETLSREFTIGTP